jgi:hypothetical protein
MGADRNNSRRVFLSGDIGFPFTVRDSSVSPGFTHANVNPHPTNHPELHSVRLYERNTLIFLSIPP